MSARDPSPLNTPAAPDPAVAGQPPAARRRAITRESLAWILYEVGYLTFTVVVFTRLLGPWLINDLGHPDWYLSATQAVGAVLLVLLMPAFGALGDTAGRRKPFLVVFTLGAAASVTGLGLLDAQPQDQVLPILLLTGLTGVCTALAFAQFEPLLARAAPPQTWGAVSGLGVGIGIVVASLAAFPLTLLAEQGGKSAAFAPSAAILLAFLLPLLVLLPEHGSGTSLQALLVRSAGAVVHALRQLRQTARRLREHEGVGRLVLARFLYTDAIGTVNIYIAVYLGYLGGFTELQTTAVIALGVACTAVGGLIAGVAVSAWGPRRPLLVALPVYVCTLALLGISGSSWAVWVLAPVGGLTLGTVWTADRVFMLNLTPPQLRGELFGLFNLVGRAAQAAAPLVLWGGVNWLLHDGTGWTSELTAARVSLVLLSTTALAGMLVLRPLDDRARYEH